MLQLSVTPGADYFDVLDIFQRDRTQPTQFLLSDTLSCNLIQGAGETPLFNPTVSWNTVNVSINFSIANSQSVLMDQNATYRCQVFAARGAVRVKIADFQVKTSPIGGTGTQQFLTYCQYTDMLAMAPWIAEVQDVDVDQEGFYAQRVLARNWMDAACLNAYRGAFVGLFEMHSYAAFAFGYAGWRRSLGPSPSLSTYLEQNLLMLTRSDGSPTQIVRCCTHRAVSEVALAQVGSNPKLYQLGLYHRDMADKEAFSTTAEINLSGASGSDVGNLFINLGATNTLAS